MCLKGFLRKHGFKDAFSARKNHGCFFPKESPLDGFQYACVCLFAFWVFFGDATLGLRTI